MGKTIAEKIFDAHRVDFEVLVKRNNMYRDKEQQSLAAFECAVDEQLKAQRECIESMARLEAEVK